MSASAAGLGRVSKLLILGGLLIPTGITAQDISDDSLASIAREIIESAKYVALITLDAEGHPQARVMDPFPPDENMIIWMATNPQSRKVVQIKSDDRVTLYYFDTAGLGTVSLMGTARLVNDPAEKAKRWKSGWEVFYPDRDSSYLLIQVRPEFMEVVSVKHGLQGDPVTWKPQGLAIPSE